MDPEARERKRTSRETAAVRRERILETARRLSNRAVLAGKYGEFGDPWGIAFVMRPETLDFLRSGPGGHFEGSPKLETGQTPKLDNTPVHFSDDLEVDQVILVYEGWPYFDED